VLPFSSWSLSFSEYMDSQSMVVSANLDSITMNAKNLLCNFHIKVCSLDHFYFWKQKIFLQGDTPQCITKVGLALLFEKLSLLQQQYARLHNFGWNLKK
jgi:hypothetical protein